MLVAGGVTGRSQRARNSTIRRAGQPGRLHTAALGHRTRQLSTGTTAARSLPAVNGDVADGKVLVSGDRLLSQRGTLRSGERHLDGHRQPRHRALDHTATLLPNGKVLVAGGYDGTISASAELYDPASGTWTATGSLATARISHGDVAAQRQGARRGRFDNSARSRERGTLRSGERNLDGHRQPRHRARLSHGDVAAQRQGARRRRYGNSVSRAARNSTMSVSDSAATGSLEIDTATPRLRSGHRLRLTGSRFQGISQASGGNTQDSSSNYPIVQLRSVESSQVVFLPVDPVGGWSDTSFISRPVRDFPSGPALVTVFTNGIPSTAKSLVVVP